MNTNEKRALALKYFNALWFSIEKHMGVDPECKDWPDVIRAELAPSEWQPIETAPKDGKPYRMKFPDGHVEIGAWRFSANAEIEAWGSFPINPETGDYIRCCFLPFQTPPIEWQHERRGAQHARLV